MKKYLQFLMVGVVVIMFAFTSVGITNAQTNRSTTTTNNAGGSNKIQEGLGSISDSFPDTVVSDAGATPQLFLKKIIDYALYLAAIIAVLFIIYGGYLYIFSGGSDDKAKQGRKTLTNALIGLVLIIVSYTIVQVVYTFLTTPI